LKTLQNQATLRGITMSFENVTKSKHGGNRQGSGRKLKSGEKTVVIRLPLSLVSKIKSGDYEIVTKSNYKQTSALTTEDIAEQVGLIERLTTENAQLQQAKKQVARWEQVGIDERLEKQILKYDAEHLKVVKLTNQLRDAKHEPKALKAEIERLKHLEHDCQCLKANGDRCTRPAKVKTKFNGVLLNTCNQHAKKLDSVTKSNEHLKG
jgi:uncharacterized protein (UPF0335 family)